MEVFEVKKGKNGNFKEAFFIFFQKYFLKRLSVYNAFPGMELTKFSQWKFILGRHNTQHNDIHHNDTQHKGLFCDNQDKRRSAKKNTEYIKLHTLYQVL